MAGYLIAEEGPLAGLTIHLEKGTTWTLGRDPDESTFVLEDPMVSRKHVLCHLAEEGIFLENLSSVNPVTQNGKVLTEKVLLREGDILEIGSTFFRFTEKKPPEELDGNISNDNGLSEVFEEEDSLPSLNFELPPPTKWLLKVISGPNTGAEFNLEKGATYLVGKDPNQCNIVFYDLSVSKEHAKLFITEEETTFIEDLGSRNGTFVNGDRISEKHEIVSQDLVALGTTSFLLIDREGEQETIEALPSFHASQKEQVKAEEKAILEKEAVAMKSNWKELTISKKHLIIGGALGLVALGLISASFSLFKSEPVEVAEKNEHEMIVQSLKPFPSIQFLWNEVSGKLFLTGHVLTGIDKQKLSYELSTLPFVRSIEDNVIIDELVWQNINAILQINEDWQAVSLHSPTPGQFVLKGYVTSPEVAESLSDYMNLNFPYLTLLSNKVSIENNLMIQIESLLTQADFRNVLFHLSGGDLVLTGSVAEKRSHEFSTFIDHLKTLPGVLSIQDYVVFTSASSGEFAQDISKQYQVTGFSIGSDDEQFVIINSKIFSTGDVLNGMHIVSIEPEQVLLEKDGLKFKINYNLQ